MLAGARRARPSLLDLVWEAQRARPATSTTTASTHDQPCAAEVNGGKKCPAQHQSRGTAEEGRNVEHLDGEHGAYQRTCNRDPGAEQHQREGAERGKGDHRTTIRTGRPTKPAERKQFEHGHGRSPTAWTRSLHDPATHRPDRVDGTCGNLLMANCATPAAVLQIATVIQNALGVPARKTTDVARLLKYEIVPVDRPSWTSQKEPAACTATERRR
jgi:hypothetical protein